MARPRNADFVLITALAAGGTAEAAAKAAGVSVATVHRRLAERPFCQRVVEARDERISRAVARLCATSTLAADTPRELLKAKAETVRSGSPGPSSNPFSTGSNARLRHSGLLSFRDCRSGRHRAC